MSKLINIGYHAFGDVCRAQVLEKHVGLCVIWTILFEDLVSQLFEHDALLFKEGLPVILALNRDYGHEDQYVLQAVEEVHAEANNEEDHLLVLTRHHDEETEFELIEEN